MEVIICGDFVENKFVWCFGKNRFAWVEVEKMSDGEKGFGPEARWHGSLD
jgi:hypothetical protein